MKKLTLITTLAISAASITGLKAQDSDQAFQASLTPDIAIHSRTTEIDGLSLSVWGENPQHGVALGFVNGSTGDSSGFTLGLVNYADAYKGVAWGVINVSTSHFVGWQSGLINVTEDEFDGFQSAWLLNYAEDMTGFQLGLVNYAENLHGLQIGLANIAMNNPWFNEFPDKLATGFPIVNWSF
mgnify:CR=1 FL=1